MAGLSGARPLATEADPRKWEDDVIPLDADGVARPIIGLGFSTARPLDIRAGGGEDEVSYNVNAPVSVDGGTGFDKLVILGTEENIGKFKEFLPDRLRKMIVHTGQTRVDQPASQDAVAGIRCFE